MLVCGMLALQAEGKIIKGKIRDAQTGEEIIGARIQVKGDPSKAVVSGLDGSFNLSVGQNAFIGLDSGVTVLEDWIIRNGMIGDFTRFLNEICDVRVRLDAASTPDNRKVLVEKHKNGDLIFSAAMSNGTAAAELFYFWMKRFNDVSFLYMDKFDAYYHFSLAGKIIELLKKK